MNCTVSGWFDAIKLITESRTISCVVSPTGLDVGVGVGPTEPVGVGVAVGIGVAEHAEVGEGEAAGTGEGVDVGEDARKGSCAAS
jgi:hypothetical protein